MNTRTVFVCVVALVLAFLSGGGTLTRADEGSGIMVTATIVCKAHCDEPPALMTATPRPTPNETPLPYITPIVGCPLWCDAAGCYCYKLFLPQIEVKKEIEK